MKMMTQEKMEKYPRLACLSYQCQSYSMRIYGGCNGCDSAVPGCEKIVIAGKRNRNKKEEKEVSGEDIINFLQNLGEKEDEALLSVLDFYGDSFYGVLKKTLDESSIEDRKTLLDHLEENYAKKTQPSS